MEIPLLRDIIIICGLALSVAFVCDRLSIPDTVGFLLTGILAGPHCMGLIKQVHEVEQMADVGVVCLLFAIGLEFSFKSLLKIKTMVLIGGTIQVGLSILMGVILGGFLGMDQKQSIFFGFLLSLSSTAIVLKILQQRAETESPHGRLILGILIFQDVAVVAMMLASPIMVNQSSSLVWELLKLAIKALAICAVVLVSTKWVAPRFLFYVARLRNRQLFLLGIVLVALGSTWLTSALGLSLALGAFLAGLIISDSEFRERVLGEILPFNDLFISFFFVSIGMLLDIKFVMSHVVTLTLVTLVVILGKFIVSSAAAISLGLPLRIAVLTGVALSQVGEFSFVLADTGYELGLVNSNTYQLFLGLSIMTMIATPFLIDKGHTFAEAIVAAPFPDIIKRGFSGKAEPLKEMTYKDHLIIVGYGIGGKNLSNVAALANIPRVIIELNPETVRREAQAGQPIHFGDATAGPVLKHAGIAHARALVIMIPDQEATRRIIDRARRSNPAIHIIARTRFVSEIDNLYALGANEVVPEEYEASIEILVRVLRKYLMPREDIDSFVTNIRSNHYRMLRSPLHRTSTISDIPLDLTGIEISTTRVKEGSQASGSTIGALEIRKKFGVTILALIRGADFITNPSANDEIHVDDVVVVLGKVEAIAGLEILFSGTRDHDPRGIL